MSNLEYTALISPESSLDLRQSQNPSSFRKGAKFFWFRISSLVISDAASLLLAWLFATAYSSPEITGNWQDIQEAIHLFIPVLGIGLGTFSTAHFYQSGNSRKDYVGLIKAISLVSLTVFILFEYFPVATSPLPKTHFLLFWIASTVFTSIGRFLVDLATTTARQAGIGVYPVFLIADLEKQANASAVISSEGHYKIVDILGSNALDRDNRKRMFDRLHQLGIIEVFVDWDAIKNRLFLCSRFQSEGFTLRILPSEELPPPSTIHYTSVGGKLCLSCVPPVLSGIEFWTKRAFDVFLAGIVVVLASPIYLLIALLIYLDSPGAIFYKQVRIGLKDKPFKVWKFRTMVPNADKLQKDLEARNETKDGVLFKIKDDPRITRVGKYLRQYSLDELPQLFNVLLGEMSLVGPRPLPLRDVEKFAQHHHIRQEVLPGITGLWQISGRSDIVDFEQAYQLDLTYITNWSILLDLKILFKTVWVVFQKSGAY